MGAGRPSSLLAGEKEEIKKGQQCKKASQALSKKQTNGKRDFRVFLKKPRWTWRLLFIRNFWLIFSFLSREKFASRMNCFETGAV